MSFDLSTYVTVAERIDAFRAKHPEGSLQQVDLQFLEFAGQCWVVYVAAAYRTPDDARPGHGAAWEPVPGKTQFTRDSELQNAQTAAMGRAIVAVLAADTKKGVASRDEVEARNAPQIPPDPMAVLKTQVWRAGQSAGLLTVEQLGARFAELNGGLALSDATEAELRAFHGVLEDERRKGAREHKQLVADVMQSTQSGRGRKDSTDKGRVERVEGVPADDEFYEPAP